MEPNRLCMIATNLANTERIRKILEGRIWF